MVQHRSYGQFIKLLLVLVTVIGLSGTAPDRSRLRDKKMPEIRVFRLDSPLSLADIDFLDQRIAQVPGHEVTTAIGQVVRRFYFQECDGDSAETLFTIGDTYFNTVQLTGKRWSVFLVLLKRNPGGQLNGKLLFYDQTAKNFPHQALDFNLHSLYEIRNNRLKTSELRKAFRIKTPEIERVNFDKTGESDFKLTRLYHNGTANALETTILKVDKRGIDTLSFERTMIN